MSKENSRGALDGREVAAGDRLPAFVRVTDLAHWNRYAAVNEEFVPIHMDPDAARAAGQPDVFGMGNLRLAYLHNLLHDWLGGSGGIVELAVQFRQLNFKGDRLEAHAQVSGVRSGTQGRFVDLEIGVLNQDGTETTPGSATLVAYDDGKAWCPAEPEATAPPDNREPGVLLDQASIEMLGSATPPVESLPVGANDIRRWAMAVYYPEPAPLEFYDEAVAARGPWGGLVAPRDFNPFAWLRGRPGSSPWFRPSGPQVGHRILNGGQRSRYFAPIRPGDVVTAVSTLVDAYEREGKLGTMLFLVSESRWKNQRGELLRIGNGTIIYY